MLYYIHADEYSSVNAMCLKKNYLIAVVSFHVSGQLLRSLGARTVFVKSDTELAIIIHPHVEPT